jgi:hypothetical protein
MNASTSNPQAWSAEYKHMLARFFLDSHLDYVPERIEWPAIPDEVRARLRALSFWQEAVSTENVTSHTVTAAAALEPDPLLRAAIELQGFEEQRHARLLQALTAHYQIKIDTPEKYQPRELENDFLSAGFGECFDSFFAFGLFALAEESGFFAPELIRIFEPVVQEEARHILFFVNWVRYRRAQLPVWRRPFFRLRCAWIILKKVRSRVRTARSVDRGQGGADDSFTLTAREELGPSMTVRRLIGVCLEENDRRMAPYDARLTRPRLVPMLARCLYRLMPTRN